MMNDKVREKVKSDLAKIHTMAETLDITLSDLIQKTGYEDEFLGFVWGALEFLQDIKLNEEDKLYTSKKY